MSEELRPNILVLAPYRGPWEVGIYLTGRVVKADCGHHAWLSLQGEPYLGVDGCQSQCMDCYDAETSLIADKDVRVVPGAVEEIRRLHGDEFTGQVKDFMRTYGIREHRND